MHYINSPKLSQTNPADFAGSLFYMYLPHKNVHIYMYPSNYVSKSWLNYSLKDIWCWSQSALEAQTLQEIWFPCCVGSGWKRCRRFDPILCFWFHLRRSLKVPFESTLLKGEYTAMRLPYHWVFNSAISAWNVWTIGRWQDWRRCQCCCGGQGGLYSRLGDSWIVVIVMMMDIVKS